MSKSSFLRFLSLCGLHPQSPEEHDLSQIRHAMLAQLQKHRSDLVERVVDRVRFADDVEALWYLRQDLMMQLSALDGETAARRQLRYINKLFKGRLPQTMGPRKHHRFSV